MSKETEALDRIQKGLRCSLEEAKEIYAYDCKVDKGEEPIPLTEEQKKIVKKMCGTGTRKTPTVYNFTPRERKKDATKEAIIAEIATFLEKDSENACENVTIVNSGRLISFTIGENKYEFTLVQKRTPKK